MERSDTLTRLSEKIRMEGLILNLASSQKCLEYHTGYRNALLDFYKELTGENWHEEG